MYAYVPFDMDALVQPRAHEWFFLWGKLISNYQYL